MKDEGQKKDRLRQITIMKTLATPQGVLESPSLSQVPNDPTRCSDLLLTSLK